MADMKRRKLTLRQPGASNSDDTQEASTEEASPAPPAPLVEASAGAGIVDPLSVRDLDTTRLKRIKPNEPSSNSGGGGSSAITEDEKFATETVHLKVIKERKGRLAGILSASQTIRRRPSADGKTEAPEPAGSKRTLKMKVPTPGETPEAPAAEQAADADGAKPVLKLSGHLVKEKGAPALEKGPKATLKIKAPAGPAQTAKSAPPPATAPSPPRTAGGDEKKKATLKIKAPASSPEAQTVATDAPPSTPGKTPASSPEAQTVATDAPPSTPGKAPASSPEAQTVATDAAPPSTSGKTPASSPEAQTVATDAAPPSTPGKAPASSPEAQTVGTDAAPSTAGKSTLKIKTLGPAPAPAPAQTTEQEAPKPSRTLKLKTLGPVPAPAQTTEQEAPKPSRTLKLKSGGPKTTQATAPQAAPAPEPVARPAAASVANPGIFYTLSAAASVALIGVAAFMMFSQFGALFGL